MAIAKISSKGWVVIPNAVRKKYGLQPGDRMSIRDEDGRIVLTPLLKDPIRELRGIFKGGPSMSAELVEEHRREIEKDAREHRAWLARQAKRTTRG